MPVPVRAALDVGADQAASKAVQVKQPARYLVASALAGVYLGVAVVVLVSVCAPMFAAGSPWTMLVSGVVFGIALTLVVFAGAELFTANAMVMLYGLLDRRVGWPQLALVWLVSMAGNLVGAVGFGLLVHVGGTLGAGTQGGRFLHSLVLAKNAATGGQLFARAVLCNMLVCLAMWMAMRTISDGAKLALLWWPLLAFVGSGFEHSVANTAMYTIAAANGDAAWLDLGRNLLWTVPGNLLGGAVLVAAAYWFIGRAAAADAPRPGTAAERLAAAGLTGGALLPGGSLGPPLDRRMAAPPGRRPLNGRTPAGGKTPRTPGKSDRGPDRPRLVSMS
jgi:nitrite transporter NirC